MNEDIYKKLTAEAREKISAKTFADFIEKTKAAGEADAGSFKVIISTADFDRQGESVNQAGWDLSFYKSNPIVLWAHDYGSLPIGVCTSISLDNGKLIAEGKFAPTDANPFAQQVRKLYDLGMVRATSVGFIPKEFDDNDRGVINKAELLEFSFVPVPANPYALSVDQVKDLGIDTALLHTKGISIQVKNAAPEKKEIDQSKVIQTFKEAMAGEHMAHANNHLAAIAVFKEAMSKIGAEKSIDLEQIACFKDYVNSHSLENDRHSKAIDSHTDQFLKDLGDSDGDADDATTAGVNEDTVKEAIDILKKYVALGSVKLPNGNKGAEDAPPKRSKNAEDLDADSFVEQRALLRGIDNSVEKLLRYMNNIAREYSTKK